jgi:transcriptional regulator with XRE-family HTH domain
MRRLNAAKHANVDPANIRRLVAATGMTQLRLAARLGISERALRYYMQTQTGPLQRSAPYTLQFALEVLARKV